MNVPTTKINSVECFHKFGFYVIKYIWAFKFYTMSSHNKEISFFVCEELSVNKNREIFN